MEMTYFQTLPRILPLKKPKGVRITLTVCGSCGFETLYIETSKAIKIASLLTVTVGQLDDFALAAFVSDRPVVVACYLQRDVAEAKLEQINEFTPFIKGPCHWFSLQSE